MAPLMRTSKSKDKNSYKVFQLPRTMRDAGINGSPSCSTVCTSSSSYDSSSSSSTGTLTPDKKNDDDPLYLFYGNAEDQIRNDEGPTARALFQTEVPAGRNLFLETLLVHFLASSIWHSEIIYFTFHFNGISSEAASCIVGSAFDGVLITAAVVWLCRGIWQGSVAELKSLTTLSPSLLGMCFRNLSFWRIAIIVYLVMSSSAMLLSDAAFQLVTGGEHADMWVVLSHMKNFRTGVKGGVKNDVRKAMITILGCVVASAVAALICLLQEIRVYRLTTTSLNYNKTSEHGKRMPMVILGWFACLVVLYSAGAWMPIFHAYASICGGFVLSPPGSEAMTAALQIDPSSIVRRSSNKKAATPNVILIIHESLSGEVMMTQESSVQATPFFHKMMQSEDEYFVFEHARTVSGDTTDAVSAIQSGCVPMDHETSRDFALKTTMATEFKRQGYETASFSSVELNYEGTKWFMTQRQLKTNFDHIVDPTVTNDPLVNPPGQDDRILADHFGTWLQERNEQEPFFAQFYYFNSHYPFFDNENRTSDSRLDGMLETVDQSIERIFRYLNETGKLENTIVIGSADHGERRTPSEYGRLREWHKDILHVPIYMHIPQKIFQAAAHQYETLRYNTQQLVSTLDIFPTIMHLLNGRPEREYPIMDAHCVRGVDLLETKIDSHRIAWSFPGVSKDFSRDTQGNFAIHKGISSSLLNRFGWPMNNSMSVVEYDSIIGRGDNKEKSKPLTIKEWKSVIQNLVGTSNDIILKKKATYIAELFKGLGIESI